MTNYIDTLDQHTKDYIYQMANRSLFNDVMNELNNKWGEFGNYINIRFSRDMPHFVGFDGNIQRHIDRGEYKLKYLSIFECYKFYILCIKKGISFGNCDDLYEKEYNIRECINHFNNHEYDNKAYKFWRNNEILRDLGGGTSICGFYSKFLKNGVKPKLINKIFQANGLNFGMREIYING